ncbi:hypothetical protein V501_09561 [Pseudogymnoascus sp. VKM F-4519 (FW-2642)]|nr:hypothetical protein V501_09561 [Pseudogymnoascus sp. VKM F-4519 (FW-2642)]
MRGVGVVFGLVVVGVWLGGDGAAWGAETAVSAARDQVGTAAHGGLAAFAVEEPGAREVVLEVGYAAEVHDALARLGGGGEVGALGAHVTPPFGAFETAHGLPRGVGGGGGAGGVDGHGLPRGVGGGGGRADGGGARGGGGGGGGGGIVVV